MRNLRHPTRTVALAFLLAILAGTCLLMTPMASSGMAPTTWLAALFTAVSAVCVTGLAVVDTGTHWSFFGQIVILVLIQLGGFGMMTAATLLGLMVNRSLRLRTKLITQVETHSIGLGDVHGVAKVVFLVTLGVELLLAATLSIRFASSYDMGWHQAVWYGIFHSISAFNNAGFSLHADSLVRYARDAWILMPIAAAIVVGGLGFPVYYDIRARLRDPRHWSLHTKLTLIATALLLVGGTVFLLLFEWSNPLTLGPMGAADKLLSAIFASVSSRTAGFNSLDIASLTQESWALHYLLMFIGGGSAGTAGGVKVGTFAVLVLLVVAEVRGRSDSEAFGRRISHSAQRQAITVLVLGSSMVVLGTMVILLGTTLPTDQVIFEVISAFGTVGLSTGITGQLPPSGQIMLILLMYVGRVGTITLAASLAMGHVRAAYRYPEEHPIVG